MSIKLINCIIIFNLGPGHVTFWTLSTGSENTAQDLGDRLRATEGRFMMTAVADVESVAATGSTGMEFKPFFNRFFFFKFKFLNSRKSRFYMSLGKLIGLGRRSHSIGSNTKRWQHMS